MPDLIDRLLEREGGYADHPADRGGPTKYGITQRTLAAWRGHPVTAADVEALTTDEARRIYWARFLQGPNIDAIADPALQEAVFDVAVLSGPEHAVRLLQATLTEFTGVPVRLDGVLGPGTLGALADADSTEVREAFVRHRILDIGRIVQGDPTQVAFLTGWLTRTIEFL